MSPIPQSNKSGEKPGEKAENDSTRIIGAAGGGVTPPPVAPDDATRLTDNGGKASADDDQATAMLGANDEPPTPPAADEEEYEPKKKSKKLWLILVILLLVGAVGAGTLWFLNNQISRSDSDKEEDAPEKESSTELDGSYRLDQPAEEVAADVSVKEEPVADSETDYYISRCYNAVDRINSKMSEGEFAEVLDDAVSLFIEASDYMKSNANPTLDAAVASLSMALDQNFVVMTSYSQQRLQSQVNDLLENYSYVIDRLRSYCP